MTFDPPVISGHNYTVTAGNGNGNDPMVLADFVGSAALTLLRDGQRRRLVGDGAEHSETIRFHQKDPGADDKDVRVWTITDHGDGTFLAAPAAAF